jgi:hypothetical protein
MVGVIATNVAYQGKLNLPSMHALVDGHCMHSAVLVGLESLQG